MIRTNAIQSATKEAAIVPMRVAEEIGSVMETIIYVAHKGNQNARHGCLRGDDGCPYLCIGGFIECPN